jgi:hypothetical protein
MADNYIPITFSTATDQQLASLLRETVDQLQRWREALARIKADMDQMTDGATYTKIETVFGLPTGKGATTYNLVTGALAELNADTSLGQLVSWLAAR